MGILSWLRFSTWKNKFLEYRRVLSVSRKPDKSEFTKAAKISTLGVAVIGALGFLVFLIYTAFSAFFMI